MLHRLPHVLFLNEAAFQLLFLEQSARFPLTKAQQKRYAVVQRQQ